MALMGVILLQKSLMVLFLDFYMSRTRVVIILFTQTNPKRLRPGSKIAFTDHISRHVLWSALVFMKPDEPFIWWKHLEGNFWMSKSRQKWSQKRNSGWNSFCKSDADGSVRTFFNDCVVTNKQTEHQRKNKVSKRKLWPNSNTLAHVQAITDFFYDGLNARNENIFFSNRTQVFVTCGTKTDTRLMFFKFTAVWMVPSHVNWLLSP